MTALSRKATIRDFPMPFLCNNRCDICGKPRASGGDTYKHTKCSKIRQAKYAALRG